MSAERREPQTLDRGPGTCGRTASFFHGLQVCPDRFRFDRPATGRAGKQIDLEVPDLDADDLARLLDGRYVNRRFDMGCGLCGLWLRHECLPLPAIIQPSRRGVWPNAWVGERQGVLANALTRLSMAVLQ